MTIATVSPGAWDEIVTTSADTVFQNQSQRPLYLTTEDTTSLDLREGLFVAPWSAVND